MSIKRYWPVYIAGFVVIAVMVTSLLIAGSERPPEPLPRNDPMPIVHEPEPNIYYQLPPEPQYVPIAKEQRSFYKTYDSGVIQYNIMKGEINVDRVAAVGPHTFHIEYLNTTASEIVLTDEQKQQVGIGCIGRLNGEYETLSPNVSVPDKLPPIKKVRHTIEVEPSCLYIGTGDHEYFWNFKE